MRAAEVHLGLDGRGTNSGGCMPENVEQFLKTDNEMRVLWMNANATYFGLDRLYLDYINSHTLYPG